ncbi:hypothetical protein BU24DRAFT_415846 [Aaosphaeria arxii CBS 175.79]|uniref:Fucose-specific lectin n=1 Tax=Aaosphaeria arxii CBS 175.79 TaxID=1450172 RepID=A0A6A5X6L5_9PLEO|nr:uncharacterized protein BU24DRAFT_415846 [Aaosphaeria arxii CBS 175.79]KAF2008487.1 hypothetical protein BU24DRAFT_415846 [Aaosphaeria arxii CBS 175.79]
MRVANPFLGKWNSSLGCRFITLAYKYRHIQGKNSPSVHPLSLKLISKTVIGRKLAVNPEFHEWSKELDDFTTWRIIRRSKPAMLLDLISGISGMEWVRDCFQPAKQPVHPFPGPTVPRLVWLPHPQSRLAVESKDDMTILLFQNSSNELVLVKLGILNCLAKTPIACNRVAPGTPLAIGWINSRLYVFFAEEDHYLRAMFYNAGSGQWREDELSTSKIQIHQESSLLCLRSCLYCQDRNGDILRIKRDKGEWLNPFNLHTQESGALQKAWAGTPLTGGFIISPTAQGNYRWIVLYYLSSKGKLVRGIDGSMQTCQDEEVVPVENPRMPAWQESPWTIPEQDTSVYPDFSMSPDHPNESTPPILFRTTGDFLNMCWQSKKDEAQWVFLPRICQTAPGSHFFLQFLNQDINESAYIFFFSKDAHLEMVEIDDYISERKPIISQRTVFHEICGIKPWKRLFPNSDSDESDDSDDSDDEDDEVDEAWPLRESFG